MKAALLLSLSLSALCVTAGAAAPGRVGSGSGITENVAEVPAAPVGRLGSLGPFLAQFHACV